MEASQKQLKKNKARPVDTNQPGYEPSADDLLRAYTVPKMSTEQPL